MSFPVHTPEQRRTRRGGGRISLVLLFAATLAVASCSEPAVPASVDLPLRIAFGIGPTVKASAVNLLADRLYTEPLISHDASGRPGPALADSWSWAEDGRVLRLRLKRGVKFHDGTPLTAPLVAAAIEANRHGGNDPIGFQRVTEIQADGDTEVIIRLSAPDYFLLTALNEVRIVHPGKPDVGTGPFELVRRAPTVQARRFAGYHGGLPGSAEVHIVTYESQRAAWAALMRGEVDAAQEISREAVDFMARTSQVRTYTSPQPFYIPLVFNQRRGALGNSDVRRALALALDRQRIVERAMRGWGIVAEGPIWRFHWAYEPPASSRSHSPRKAVELLEKAGYRLQAATATTPARRLSFRCLFVNEDPQYERIALMVQRQLFDIGVDVELLPLSLRDLAIRAGTGDFDVLLAPANAGRSLMFTYLFWRSPTAEEPPIWQTGYTGADTALDRLRASTSDEELRASLRQLSQRFRHDAPAAFIAWTQVTRAVSSDISIGEEPTTDPFMSLWKWRRTAADANQ